MFTRISTYKKSLLLVFILAMLLPCTVKRDWKQLVQASSHEVPMASKTVCSTVYVMEQTAAKATLQVALLPIDAPVALSSATALVHHTLQEHLFLILKEKVPTYIKLRQFRI